MDLVKAAPIKLTFESGELRGTTKIDLTLHLGVHGVVRKPPTALSVQMTLDGPDVMAMTVREIVEEVARALIAELSDALAVQPPQPPTPDTN